MKHEVISTISKNKKIHYYKKITYNVNTKYRKVEYCYDILDKNEEIIDTKYHSVLNKPTIIYYYSNKITKLEYWYKGKKHREYAPAILSLNGKEIIFEEWYHNGIKLSDEEIENIKKVLNRRRKFIKIIIKSIQKKKEKDL